MNKIAIIQARMNSSRFPGKVLELLKNKPLLQWVIDRVLKISTINRVIVATSDSTFDNRISEFCNIIKLDCFRGSETDVLGRFYHAAMRYNADVIVRITADCPLIDPYIAEQLIYLVSSGLSDYASNVLPATWPDGLDCEVFTISALKKAFECATRESDREHVTPYIRNNQSLFRVHNLPSPNSNLRNHRWTVDIPEDLRYLEQILLKIEGEPTTWGLLQVLSSHPDIRCPSSLRNEGFAKSLREEKSSYKDFQNSKKLLEQSLKRIPLGAQTFSKSYIQYPKNTSPMFLTHGVGARVWDVDGNEYIDLVSGLLPIVLGYNDPDVNEAIQHQLFKGISFSLSTELEVQLAEKLCSKIPSAEKVRFAKNGTDVTSAAIRLARAYTGRERIIVCGYHGWQDWYIGTTARNKGVPKSVSDLSTTMLYNDLDKIETLLKTETYACIILEPCNVAAPAENYLSNLKIICEQHGSLLIFDEVVTGFRFALGGAQEYFDVTPHLSCFGKAMGNGMPISAIVGQSHIMKEMEEIFFSGTFGGEALSLAASLATIKKMEKENVINYLWSFGQSLTQSIEKLIIKYDLTTVLKLVGYAPWKIIQFFDHPCGAETGFAIKTFFIQEMIKRGILINASFNINFSHTKLENVKILNACDEVMFLISNCLRKSTLNKNLKSPVIQPLFRIR